MPTKAELKSKKTKLKLRSGDRVIIIAGKDKGQIGFIAAVDPEKRRALVLQDNDENPEMPNPLNAAVKHKKAKYQGEQSARYRIPAPIDMSNLMLLDPKDNKPTRVGRRKEGDTIVRYAKRSGTTLTDAHNVMLKGDKK